MNLTYHIALSGIRVAQGLITTSQNNIANAKSAGYARQRVDVSSINYLTGSGGIRAQFGSGAVINQLTRITDELSIQQVRNESANIGKYEAMRGVLSNIETSFSELTESSISNLTQMFFNSFEEASKFPEQSSYRVGLINSGELLTDKIKEVATHLDTTKNEIISRMNTEVERINQLIGTISEINERIQLSKTDSPNALLDDRDKHLDELSKLINIEIRHQSSPGDLIVKFGNVNLVTGKDSNFIELKTETLTREWILGVNDIEVTSSSGSISGLVELKSIIDDYENRLNKFVTELMNKVNEVHSAGYGLDGSTGVNYFTGTDIRTISINEDLQKNVNLIALSSEEGISGNGDVAKEISAIQRLSYIDGRTPRAYFQEFMIDMGNATKNAETLHRAHLDVREELESYRQSVQGVDIDEEIMRITEYQQFYQANAKSLKVVESLLDQLLSII